VAMTLIGEGVLFVFIDMLTSFQAKLSIKLGSRMQPAYIIINHLLYEFTDDIRAGISSDDFPIYERR
jgi:hypothetical protein